jgi:hypothetical protein
VGIKPSHYIFLHGRRDHLHKLVKVNLAVTVFVDLNVEQSGT